MSTPSVRVGPAVTADMRGGAAETGAAETGSAAVSADTAGTAAQTEGLRVAAVALATAKAVDSASA